VELLAAMHKDHEKLHEEELKLHKDNELRMARMMQSITRLSNITAVHDIQIDDHEHRIGDLEKDR
jgi:hypothetical protein